jgi:hypothetical protein
MSEKKNPIEIVVKMPVGTTGGFFQFEPIRDEAGLVNLTDLWRRFGAIDNKNPYEWSRKEGRNFIEAICRELITPRSRIYRSQRGRGGSSLAHWQVAMTYLTYLSPEAQMLVNRIVKERIEEEADPELGVRRAIQRHTRRLKASGRSDEDVEKRLKTVAKRNALTSTLERHGVGGCKDPNRNGFAGVTNALYLGWKGKTAPDLRRELGVPAGGNLRDRLDGFDLDQLAFAEAMLERKVRLQNLYGAEECSRSAHSVGKAVGLVVDHVVG